jgi:hypothetical protein
MTSFSSSSPWPASGTRPTAWPGGGTRACCERRGGWSVRRWRRARCMSTGFLKDWLFSRMNMFTVPREVKRLQVQVAMLADKRA